MFKTIFSILVIVAVAYSAYLVHERFFSGKSPLSAADDEEEQTTPFLCPQDLTAYDPNEPSKKIGVFLEGTEIHLSPADPATGMTPVSLLDPDGNTLHALCRTEDLTAPPATNVTLVPKPLELKPTKLQGDGSSRVRIGDTPTGVKAIGDDKK